jgi:Ankyrin repeats (3 copies)
MRLCTTLLLVFPMFGADPQPDLIDAARKGRNEIVETLLAKGGDIETKDRDGRTPLMIAAQYGRTATVQLLLGKGAKPDIRDSRGWNAYMLALLAPSGGVVHTPHDAVLKLLPAPRRFRLQVNAGWSPGKSIFSSCFMRSSEMTEHVRQIRPDAIVIEALQRFASASGRGLIAIVRADARGTSEKSNLAPASDTDATLDLYVEPGMACVQGSDHLTMLVRAELVNAQNGSSLLDRVFGTGVKTGMKSENATNPNQHAPLYEAWARSQAGSLYWAVVEALLLREW